MSPQLEKTPNAAGVLFWWLIWGATLGGLILIAVFLGGPNGIQVETGGVAAYLGLFPLVVSCVLRWLVLGKQREAGKALVVFILGMAMAEGCGIIGLMLGGELRTEFFMLGVLGVLQWMPLFARRFHEVRDGRAHGLRST
jgi:hypothetical protein